VPTPFPDPAAAPAFSLGTDPKVIVEVLPQPLLLVAPVPPALPLDPELELSFAPDSGVEASALVELASIEVPEFDVEPLPDVLELDPLPPPELPELATPPEEAAAASLSGEPSLVVLLPHAPAIATRHARRPISAVWRRTPQMAAIVSMMAKRFSGGRIGRACTSRAEQLGFTLQWRRTRRSVTRATDPVSGLDRSFW
jgi:hypothetical protein